MNLRSPLATSMHPTSHAPPLICPRDERPNQPEALGAALHPLPCFPLPPLEALSPRLLVSRPQKLPTQAYITDIACVLPLQCAQPASQPSPRSCRCSPPIQLYRVHSLQENQAPAYACQFLSLSDCMDATTFNVSMSAPARQRSRATTGCRPDATALDAAAPLLLPPLLLLLQGRLACWQGWRLRCQCCCPGGGLRRN